MTGVIENLSNAMRSRGASAFDDRRTLSPPSPHPVIDLMLRRRESDSRPGERNDTTTLALAIEGGGMRGVVSAGMLVALEQLGFGNVFDRIYGASAGALNATYFMTGEAAYGTTIYYEDLVDRRFIDMRRLLSRTASVVSVEYLIDEAMNNHKPVDWQSVFDSRIALHIIAACLTSDKDVIETVDLGHPRTQADMRNALLASARVPVLGGQPVEIDGHRYLDSSAYLGIPYEDAAGDGASHIFALLTRPRGEVRQGLSLFDRTIIASRLARVDPRLPETVRGRIDRYRATVSSLEAATRDPGGTSVRVPVFAVQPVGERVGQLEQGRAKLVAGATAGMIAVFRAFGSDPQIVSILRAFE